MAYSIYEYQRLVGPIQDQRDLRAEFIKVFDEKDKKQVAKFGLKYADHIIEITNFEDEAIQAGLKAVQEWLEGKTNYHKARNIAFSQVNAMVRDRRTILEKTYLKTMSQLICIPHVKAHGLWATDMAITLVNALYPGDEAKVALERQLQIDLLRAIK